ncbi:MAG: hypothetical protein HY869_00690 [Chloroflexi bacterium]|nr:hypothetical protein [Chloroflexota bacterium]
MREMTGIAAERAPSKLDRFRQVAMLLLVFVMPLCFIEIGVIAYIPVFLD